MLYEDVLKSPDNFDFRIPSLGECRIASPVKNRHFVGDDEEIIFASQVKHIRSLLN